MLLENERGSWFAAFIFTIKVKTPLIFISRKKLDSLTFQENAIEMLEYGYEYHLIQKMPKQIDIFSTCDDKDLIKQFNNSFFSDEIINVKKSRLNSHIR